MGMESASLDAQDDTEIARKWLKFTDSRGIITEVGVFGNETDEEALARARAIDASLGDKNTF